MELNRKFFASLRRRRFCGNRRDRFIDSHWQETRAGSRADIRRSRLPALMFRYITINYKTSISLTFKPVASAICSTKIMGSLSLHSDREYQWRICSIPANSLPLLSEGGKGRQERETITGSKVLRVYEPPKSFLFSCKVQIECQRHCSLFRVQDQTTIGQFLH